VEIVDVDVGGNHSEKGRQSQGAGKRKDKHFIHWELFFLPFSGGSIVIARLEIKSERERLEKLTHQIYPSLATV
jgi:hypothetical protein